MMKNERGFTLLEAIISLVIVGVLSLVSYSFIVNLYDYIQLNRVVTVFQSDLHYARDFNMMPFDNEEQMMLRIYHQEDRYVLMVDNEVRIERKLPRNISFPHINTVSNISFNQRGNLGAGRTILLSGRSHEKRIVFSVGVGGFDVRN